MRPPHVVSPAGLPRQGRPQSAHPRLQYTRGPTPRTLAPPGTHRPIQTCSPSHNRAIRGRCPGSLGRARVRNPGRRFGSTRSSPGPLAPQRKAGAAPCNPYRCRGLPDGSHIRAIRADRKVPLLSPAARKVKSRSQRGGRCLQRIQASRTRENLCTSFGRARQRPGSCGCHLARRSAAPRARARKRAPPARRAPQPGRCSALRGGHGTAIASSRRRPQLAQNSRPSANVGNRSECRGQTHARSPRFATPPTRVRPVRGSRVQPAGSSRHASSIHLAAPRIALIGVA